MGCQKHSTQLTMAEMTQGSPSIDGKKAYLESPMVTAGDRVYMVGYQDGSFPPLGWHVQGEMGGIWDHPIKLMDGFKIQLIFDKDTLALDRAQSFTNYPYANKQTFLWEEKGLEIERWQFVPDAKEGVFVQLVIKNNAVEKKGVIKFTGTSDLRPTWLGERTQMVDGKDLASWDENHQAWVVKDSLNTWFTVFGSELEFEQTSNFNSTKTKNNTSINSIEDVIFLFSNGTKSISYCLSGSYTSRDDAIATFKDLQKNASIYLSEKRKRYETLANKTKLTTPNSTINQTFEWLKYNCDWLVRTVPEIGTGIGAGLPDYPWWFGVDSEYALQGYMAMGQTEPVYKTIALLDSVSNAINGNGRIIHEMSSNGAVFNPGNINETPQFASLIWKIYQWNGDKEFLQKYFPTIEKGLDWLLKERDQNGNLFPDGFGMMEIHGMDSEMIDVASYTQKAFADAAMLAAELGKVELSEKYSTLALQLKEQINEQFWNEAFQSYADFIGTDAQALKLIDDAIVRADTLNKPWAVEELKETRDFIIKNPSITARPFVVHHNWVVNTPMETKIAPKEKAVKALTTAKKFSNPFGMFVTGIDRDASAGNDEGSFEGSKVFSYTGAVMTLPTGVQVVGENNYNRPNEALDYLKRMAQSFSYAFPGSMYEVSPDYGMMTQAWNVYGFAVPIVEQFFGIQPDAAHKKVVIHMQMPNEWKEASLENVAVGTNEISIFYSDSTFKKSIEIRQTNPAWQIEFLVPEEEHCIVNTLTTETKILNENGFKKVVATGKKINIELNYD
ncbi:MAG: glycogen debranching protein [Alteromonas sp.]|nr:glycogen debranching protein [Flavobacteriaceae bacterium]MCB9212423.1 glycogen debranching protein [Alteromonas sp.]